MLRAYIAAVSSLSRALAAVSVALLVAAMLVVCHLILMRYVFREPTVWQTDFVVFAATAAIFIGAPYVLLEGGHVGVDVVEMTVGPRTRGTLKLVGKLFGLTFCVVMLAASWLQFQEAWVNGWTAPTVWSPPLWIPLSALPVGFAMLCLQYVAEILRPLAGESPR